MQLWTSARGASGTRGVNGSRGELHLCAANISRMRATVFTLLLLSPGCSPQALASTPPAAAPPGLASPPQALPNAAITFAVEFGKHDEMLGRSPELAKALRGLMLRDPDVSALGNTIAEYQRGSASVFGALAGPTAEAMEHADQRLHATDDLFQQAFALEQPLGRHLRLYVPTEDSRALTRALVAWSKATFGEDTPLTPAGPCVAEGSAYCVLSSYRYIAVTDEGWGTRLDLVTPLWPNVDDEHFLDYAAFDDNNKRKAIVGQLKRLGLEDAFRATGTQLSDYWRDAYAAPGIDAKPPPATGVRAWVDPHAVVRLAQANSIAPQYAHELQRGLWQEREQQPPDDLVPEPTYEIPSLASLTTGVPFSHYVAHWAFQDDSRSIQLQWTLNETGHALLGEEPPSAVPDPAAMCDGTAACVAFSGSVGGLLNAKALDPNGALDDSRYLLWPLVLGAWPNVVGMLREALPLVDPSVTGTSVGALWSNGRKRVEFAAGSWSTTAPSPPVISDATQLPLDGGQRYYTEDSNFVVMDTPPSDPTGWIAASDLVRAAWLNALPKSASVGGAMLRISDLLVVYRMLFGMHSGATRWSALSADLAHEGDVISGSVVLSGRRAEVVR